MKYHERYILLILSLTLMTALPALTGCESTLTDVETVNIELRIGLGTTGNGVETAPWTKANEEDLEGIRTLRVIVCSAADANGDVTLLHDSGILSNFEFNSSAPHVTLPIPNIPFGTATFYVIANEQSLGESTLEELLTNKQTLNSLGNTIINNSTFPITGFGSETPSDVNSKGLPITGFKTIEVSNNMSSVEVDLYRAVAKICVKIENATNSDLFMLKKIEFSSIVSDNMYLFPNYDNRGDVPENTIYSPLIRDYSNETISIQSYQTADFFTAYIYPYEGNGGKDNFSITLFKDGNPGGLTATIKDREVIIPRNTQVNILAKVNTNVSISIDFEVMAWNDGRWDEFEIDVPEFI